MDGNQQAAYERLQAILSKLRNGFYGSDDDLDVGALQEDLEAVTDDM